MDMFPFYKLPPREEGKREKVTDREDTAELIEIDAKSRTRCIRVESLECDPTLERQLAGPFVILCSRNSKI